MCVVLYCVQILLNNATNPVYSDEQVTQGNPEFIHDLSLSPTHSHLYVLTEQRVCAHFELHLTVGYQVLDFLAEV